MRLSGAGNATWERRGVSRSGFYARLTRRRSQRNLADERLGALGPTS